MFQESEPSPERVLGSCERGFRMDCRLLDRNADFGFCAIILSNLLPSNSLKLGIEIRRPSVFDIHLYLEPRKPPVLTRHFNHLQATSL